MWHDAELLIVGFARDPRRPSVPLAAERCGAAGGGEKARAARAACSPLERLRLLHSREAKAPRTRTLSCGARHSFVVWNWKRPEPARCWVAHVIVQARTAIRRRRGVARTAALRSYRDWVTCMSSAIFVISRLDARYPSSW